MTMLYPGDSLATPPLPELFEYNEQTKVLEVEYTDGTRIRYFDVPSTVHFLLPIHVNSHRNADFLQARSQYRSEKLREGEL
jgi:KTSC domain-containing protein